MRQAPRWLAFGLPLSLAFWLALGAIYACVGCSLLPFGWGGTMANPSPQRPDVLSDPVGHVTSWARTLLQWAVILGVICLFPRPRSILLPIISWMWTIPQGKVTAKEAVKDVALAPLRLTGLVHSRKPVCPDVPLEEVH